MNNITPFDFEGKAVRSTIINDEPWFVAMDICKILGISNSQDAIIKLDEDEKDSIGLTDTMGRNKDLSIINESGLYMLIFRSRKATTSGTPQHRFRKWVTSEVLPSIRKTGGYTSETVNPHNEIMTQDVEETLSYYSSQLQLQQDLIGAQQEVMRLQDLIKEKDDKYVKAINGCVDTITRRTDLTNEEISDIFEDYIGSRSPEWAAWRRRISIN